MNELALTRPAGVATVRAWAMRIGAWLAAALTVAMVVGAVLLSARSGTGDEWLLRSNYPALLHPLISVFVGALVIDRRGNHIVGWLFCTSGLGWGLGYLGGAAGMYVQTGGSFPGIELLTWSIVWGPFLGFGLAPVLVIYVFPSGQLASPRWRWSLAYTVGTIAIGTLGYMLVPGPIEDMPALDNPFGVGGTIGTIADAARNVAWPLLLIAIAAGVVSLRQRMRDAPFEQRQQIKWFAFAGTATVGFVATWGALDMLGYPEGTAFAAGLFLPMMPIALGIAILRHRLYDIDVLINRTLVYLSLSAVLAAVYLGAVFLLQRGLSPVTEDSNIAVAASTLAVAALFRPVRGSLQHFIDRRFYRSKYDAAATLARFATRARDEVDMDFLTAELLTLVGDTLQPTTAAVWLSAQEAP